MARLPRKPILHHRAESQVSLESLPALLVTAESYGSAPSPQRPLIDSRQFAMLIFIVTEVMFFASLVSAYLIIRSGVEEWPPWGQPRLPVWSTALNTAVLLSSGVAAYLSGRQLRAGLEAAHRTMGIAVALGTFFLVFQGYEWMQMLGFGLTMTSSTYGGLFYLIIGTHGVHVLGALTALAYTWLRTAPGQEQPITQGGASAVRMLWYFVVGVWPILYVLVYLA